MSQAEFPRVDRLSLEDFCAAVFRSCGVDDPDARVQAEVLAAADCRGIPSHGVARLGRYVAGLESGQMLPRAKPRILRESPVSLLVDAAGGLGAPVSLMAMRSTLAKARASGLAFSCVGNSNHFGIAGYYAQLALPEGMLGMAMTNTAALGVPTFGRQVMFGTNPLAFAAPADEEKAFLLDMSTTVVTRGKIETYDRLGKSLPPGWAVDKKGRTALEPAGLLQDMLKRAGGGIVPLGGESEQFGGHKGYGLAVMVDILTGLLSGGGFGLDVMDTDISSARVSHCFAAMRIDLFREPSEFKKDMDRLLSDLRSCPPAEGKERVYYAGLKEREFEAECAISGVPLEEGVLKKLLAMAETRGLEPPRIAG